jgi:hypothetical protein
MSSAKRGRHSNGNDHSKTRVIISYQGAYACPHLGHKGGAQNSVRKALELYPLATHQIDFRFMPSNEFGSKDSLSAAKAAAAAGGAETSDFFSEQERKDMLEIYCTELAAEFPGVNFSVSDVEYELGRDGFVPYADDANQTNGQRASTPTVYTLRKLKTENPDALLVVIFGIDNWYDFLWWRYIQGYNALIDKLFVVMRAGATADLPPKADGGAGKPAFAGAAARTVPGLTFATGEPIEFTEYVSWVWPGAPGTVSAAAKLADATVGPALAAIAPKAYLIDPPVGYSSTEVRGLLRSLYNKNPADADTAGIIANLVERVGRTLARYLVERCIRTKDYVRDNVAAIKLQKIGNPDVPGNNPTRAGILALLPAAGGRRRRHKSHKKHKKSTKKSKKARRKQRQ